jgi:predicted metalloprotease with PDZ domain
MIDLFIIEHSDGKHSLNDVMKRLYDDFLTTGYTEDDFQNLCVEYGGLNVSEVFSNHIYGIEDYTESLKSAMKIVGFELVKTNNPNPSANKFGFISIVENNKHIIKKIQNRSIADNSGIAVEDEILAIDGKEIKGQKISDLLKDSKGLVKMTIKKRFNTVDVNLECGHYYPIYCLEKQDKASEKQLMYRTVWAK